MLPGIAVSHDDRVDLATVAIAAGAECGEFGWLYAVVNDFACALCRAGAVVYAAIDTGGAATALRPGAGRAAATAKHATPAKATAF